MSETKTPELKEAYDFFSELVVNGGDVKAEKEIVMLRHCWHEMERLYKLDKELNKARADIEKLKKRSLAAINNATKLSGAEYIAAKRLRQESSPEALESERAANAILTEELEQARAEIEGKDQELSMADHYIYDQKNLIEKLAGALNELKDWVINWESDFVEYDEFGAILNRVAEALQAYRETKNK